MRNAWGLVSSEQLKKAPISREVKERSGHSKPPLRSRRLRRRAPAWPCPSWLGRRGRGVGGGRAERGRAGGRRTEGRSLERRMQNELGKRLYANSKLSKIEVGVGRYTWSGLFRKLYRIRWTFRKTSTGRLCLSIKGGLFENYFILAPKIRQLEKVSVKFWKTFAASGGIS